MKSTLYFYKLPINLINKNFVLESIETYLATLTPVTKSDFQYQRFDLEKVIKVNMSQDYQLNISSLVKYNYLKVTTHDESNNLATYYYFVKSARQISESTIEFGLVMDVLNTFNYSGTASPKTYTLSDKTLVTREHKNRFGDIEEIKGSLVYGTDPVDGMTYKIDIDEILDNWTPELDVPYNFSRYTTFNVKAKYGITGENEVSYEDIEDITFTPTGTPLYLKVVLAKRDGTTYTIQPFYTGLSELLITFTSSTYDHNSIYTMLSDTYSYPYRRVRRRIIDEYQEGLGTTLFKKREQKLTDSDGNNQWYVVFASTNALGDVSVSSVKYVNPVQVRFYSDKGYSISTSSSTEKILYATSPLIPQWSNSAEYLKYLGMTATPLGEVYVKINGTTYDFANYTNLIAKRTNNNDRYFSVVEITRRSPVQRIELTNVESITFYGINEIICEDDWNQHITSIYIGSGAGTYSGTSPNWENVDLTDPRLIKAFAFPFAPCQFLEGKTAFTTLPDGFTFNADDFIEMTKPQKPTFNYTKDFGAINPQKELFIGEDELTIDYEESRTILAESKLLHSDYYQPKFVYDSFSFSFNLENVDINEYLSFGYFYETFNVTYVVSQNVQSKFMFMFPQYTLKKATQDYDNVLCIERNNEKALFNNAYINYIRSGGYSYDTKKASAQNTMNGISTAFAIIGAVGSFASTPYTGVKGVVAGITLTTTAITSIMRSVHTAQEQDRAIGQKINQQFMQGTSVQGSEDIDILTAFSGNKPKLVYYELSDIMKNAMWDLFHYCGYATHEQKIPVVNSRIYFNFVQANIVLKDFTFNNEIAEEIIKKWNDGITFMHLVNSSYDFEQQYENYESNLIS